MFFFRLTIHGTRPQNEGEYQCLAEISRIRLTNRQLITTTMISSPLKIRRARFTKFDITYLNHVRHFYFLSNKQFFVSDLIRSFLFTFSSCSKEQCKSKNEIDCTSMHCFAWHLMIWQATCMSVWHFVVFYKKLFCCYLKTMS